MGVNFLKERKKSGQVINNQPANNQQPGNYQGVHYTEQEDYQRTDYRAQQPVGNQSKGYQGNGYPQHGRTEQNPSNRDYGYNQNVVNPNNVQYVEPINVPVYKEASQVERERNYIERHVQNSDYGSNNRYEEPSHLDRHPKINVRDVEDYNVEPRFQHMDESPAYDRRLTPVGVLEMPAISDFNYSNPDTFGLQVLGVSSSDKVRIIKPKALEIKPIEISNIVDSTGKVSAKLMQYMDKTSATVLPLRECGVFENIVDIKGFRIIEVKGKKFASYCGSGYPTVYLEKLISRIVYRISSAMPFGADEDIDTMGGHVWNREESKLSRIVTINGREVEVPSLCNSEIEYICARLKPYNCNILDVVNDFSHIIVGVDLEGVGFSEKDL